MDTDSLAVLPLSSFSVSAARYPAKYATFNCWVARELTRDRTESPSKPIRRKCVPCSGRWSCGGRRRPAGDDDTACAPHPVDVRNGFFPRRALESAPYTVRSLRTCIETALHYRVQISRRCVAVAQLPRTFQFAGRRTNEALRIFSSLDRALSDCSRAAFSPSLERGERGRQRQRQT